MSGFGNFDLRDKRQRPGRNPKTGEEIPITASCGDVPSWAETQSESRGLCWKPSHNDELPAIPGKRYFTIGEVSELCAVKPHVLRYWEQEFSAEPGEASW